MSLCQLAFGQGHDDQKRNVQADLHAREAVGWLGLPRFWSPHKLWGIEASFMHHLRILLL
jgi:hypothetical protein